MNSNNNYSDDISVTSNSSQNNSNNNADNNTTQRWNSSISSFDIESTTPLNSLRERDNSFSDEACTAESFRMRLHKRIKKRVINIASISCICIVGVFCIHLFAPGDSDPFMIENKAHDVGVYNNKTIVSSPISNLATTTTTTATAGNDNDNNNNNEAYIIPVNDNENQVGVKAADNVVEVDKVVGNQDDNYNVKNNNGDTYSDNNEDSSSAVTISDNESEYTTPANNENDVTTPANNENDYVTPANNEDLTSTATTTTSSETPPQQQIIDNSEATTTTTTSSEITLPEQIDNTETAATTTITNNDININNNNSDNNDINNININTNNRHPNDYNPLSISSSFVSDYCDLQSLSSLYPSQSKSWQLRTPYVLLAGVQHTTLNNDGTRLLASLLSSHPQMIPPKTTWEPHFFSLHFGKFLTAAAAGDTNTNQKVKVVSAREAYYITHYKTIPLQEDETKYTFDATPTIFYTRALQPEHVLCVVPWTKLVVVLTNPIDRLYNNWYDAANRHGLTVPFEDWITNELEMLSNVGFIKNNNNNNENVDNTNEINDISNPEEKEDEAFLEYHGISLAGGVGQSLYEIQLRHWCRAFQRMHGEQEEEEHLMDQNIHIILWEEFIQNPKDGYNQMLQFLGLPVIPDNRNTEQQDTLEEEATSNDPEALFQKISSFSTTITTSSGDPSSKMKDETRNMLRQFFQPYNQKLNQLLQKQFGYNKNLEDYWN